MLSVFFNNNDNTIFIFYCNSFIDFLISHNTLIQKNKKNYLIKQSYYLVFEKNYYNYYINIKAFSSIRYLLYSIKMLCDRIK